MVSNIQPASLFIMLDISIICATIIPTELKLDYIPWMVHNGNESISISATVPGGIYTDLRNAGILFEDLLYRFNDEAYRWVAWENWTYTATFNVEESLFIKRNIFLEFEGLDTVSSVYLNKHYLGSTNNMFVLFRFSIKQYLLLFNNSLEVHFTSPLLSAREKSKESNYEVPPSCVPAEYHGECHVNYLRKMQASFAWDWGPAFPSVGMWKSVWVRGYSRVFARSVGVETKPDTYGWIVSSTLYIEVAETVSGTLVSELLLDKFNKVSASLNVSVSPNNKSPVLILPVPKSKVCMWWPNGLGDQPLYSLTVSFICDTEITKVTIKIGFRTIQLVQSEVVSGIPAKGLTFYFRVNGVAFFAKGSNYIPAHILPELSTNIEYVSQLLFAAKDANMNMLRVWGGGVYESDKFYELCDELGLLVWQDMMFACSMYPSSADFLQSVINEVTHQVRRLQHHPSIALWAGNNENEAALRGNWYGTQSNFSLYKSDYIKLYVEVIRPLIFVNDKTRSFVVSSPSNGLKSEQEGYIAQNPYNSLYGDVHVYRYLLNLWNPEIFPKTRFASEYGSQSLPSLEAFSNITIPEDLKWGSKFLNRRQHHLSGYAEMIFEINLNLPKTPETELETIIYLSQINQAMSMKTETEAYRRSRSYLSSIGEGQTMGALYWQLNDVWQAPSWSSIEFGGKWKMLHYFVVDFFAPVLVSPSVDITNRLHVHAISDLRPNFKQSLILQISVYQWDSLLPRWKQYYPFVLVGSSVVEVGCWDLEAIFKLIPSCAVKVVAEKACFLHFSLRLDNKSANSVGPDNFIFPSPLNLIFGLQNANISVSHVTALNNRKELIVTLTSDAIALFVWLEVLHIPGRFSHNGFLMVSQEAQVTFISSQPIEIDLFIRFLKIKSLKQTYP